MHVTIHVLRIADYACSVGPLGQGIANAVGLALAEAHLAARFNKDDAKIVDHYTYCIMGDGCARLPPSVSFRHKHHMEGAMKPYGQPTCSNLKMENSGLQRLASLTLS